MKNKHKLYNLEQKYTNKNNQECKVNLSRLLLMPYEIYSNLRTTNTEFERILLLTHRYMLTSTIYTRFWTRDDLKFFRDSILSLEDSNFRRFWLLYIIENLHIVTCANFSLDAMFMNGWEKDDIKSIKKSFDPIVADITDNFNKFLKKVKEQDLTLSNEEYDALKRQDCLFPEKVDNLNCIFKH